MESARAKRRLAAIMAADVVGFSRLMSEDEERTLLMLNQRLMSFQQTIPEHDGRIFGGAGDSVIAEFPSAVEAVRCAVEIQQALARCNAQSPDEEHMQFRIGINVGDVIVEGDNLMGDGVNIAARLESLAEPGGINISADVYHQVHNKVQAEFQDLGLRTLKNIPKPIQAYRVVMGQPPTTDFNRPRRTRVAAPLRSRIAAAGAVAVLAAVVAVWFASQRGSLPPHSETRSIAVLPFTNLSNDPEQDYFSDGITVDLITDLSKISELVVSARSAVFGYKGRPLDIRDVSRELGVRYILEGSVRRSGESLRINVQLVDAGTESQLWAERFEGRLADIFALQDEIAARTVSALQVQLSDVEHRKLVRRHTPSVDAYDLYLRGVEKFAHVSREDNLAARELFQSATEIDPKFARAYAALANTYSVEYSNWWSEDPEHSLERAYVLAQKAVDLDDSLSHVHFALARVLRESKKLDQAIVEAKRSIDIDPNYTDGYVLLASILTYAGRPRESLDVFDATTRLNPPQTARYHFHRGQAYYTLERYEEAAELFERGLEQSPNSERLQVWLVAAYAQAGRLEEAKWKAQELALSHPDISVARVQRITPYQDPAHLERLLDGLRKAGLVD